MRVFGAVDRDGDLHVAASSSLAGYVSRPSGPRGRGRVGRTPTPRCACSPHSRAGRLRVGSRGGEPARLGERLLGRARAPTSDASASDRRRSRHSIWFSDPPFGILTNYQGTRSPIELPSNIYRLDPRSGQATVVEGTLSRPNGVIFSPDESKCYIEDSGPNPRPIYAYDVVDNGTRLANRRILISADDGGTPDGFRVDIDGNLWCGWGMGSAELDGVKVFNPAGKPIGFIALPERCANLCFGGPKRNRLFMTASHSLYSLYVNAQGAGA